MSAERMFRALAWYARHASGLGAQSNSAGLPPVPGLGERLRATRAPVVSVAPALDGGPNFVDRYRHRFTHTAPTVQEVAEWGRLLHRHQAGPDDPQRCAWCQSVFPCHPWVDAFAALLAAAAMPAGAQADTAARLLAGQVAW